MPTPDTETLAARLRAVERALTDEDATPDPPTASDREEAPSEAGTLTASADDRTEPAAATEHRNDPAPTVERRLCRLEAAVQALRAALDEHGTGTTTPGDPVEGKSEPDESDPRPPVGPDGDTAGDLRRHRRVPDGGPWPDDLAPE